MPTFTKTIGLTDKVLTYCSGCSHGITHRLIAEVLEEFNVLGDTIGIAPVGCSVYAYDYFNCDMIQAPHGRAPAVATGVKRADSSKIVFTYQGDGDLSAIGIAEAIHAGARGENITVIFINNATYGMTGGQMSPTTLMKQVTQTTPHGRDTQSGYPINVCELISTLQGVSYCERVAMCDVANIIRAKKAIKKAFQTQIENKGFSLIEVLSTCPTNWGKSPQEAMDWIKTDMIKQYPLGVYKCNY